MLRSKGAAGVTGAGFITLAATLSVVPSVPVAGMALILGVDRFMSECRALTNFIGNAVATIVVARWEGALDEAKFAAVFARGEFEQGVLVAPVEMDEDYSASPAAGALGPRPELFYNVRYCLRFSTYLRLLMSRLKSGH